MTKSYIPAANTPAQIDVPIRQLTNESKIRLKRGRPVNSKDITSQNRRTQEKLGTLKEVIKMTDQFKVDKSIALEETQIMQKAPKRHILNKKPFKRHILSKKPLKRHILNKKPLNRHKYLKIVRSQ